MTTKKGSVQSEEARKKHEENRMTFSVDFPSKRTTKGTQQSENKDTTKGTRQSEYLDRT